MFRTRLAHEGAHVDQPGSEHPLGTIDRLGLPRPSRGRAVSDVGDPPVAHEQAAGSLAAGRRIEEAGVRQDKVAHGAAPSRRTARPAAAM